MTARPRGAVLIVCTVLGGCAGAARTAPAPNVDPVPPDQTRVTVRPARDPVLAPQFAMLAGLLPRRAIGVDAFLDDYPTADGRGVLIAILDSGVDVGLPGLRRTTTDAPKLADVRDFSGEGHVPLVRVEPDSAGDVVVDGRRLSGLGRVRRLADPPFYAGIFAERPLGSVPAADVNGDGDNADTYPVLVARASDGWIVMADTDGDGTLADERAVRDFAVAGEWIAFGPLTLAVNFSGGDARPPRLDLFFDNSGHGSHVAGIAAGHDLFEVEGFDGIAPGAQLLGLKISNNARGGISVTSSMVRAMEYAAEFADVRGLPLVLNLSFGVGNEVEGHATIDSIVDAFAVRHPDILFVIAATNDGPGLSTVGFPGSAEFALTACALFPGVFAQPPQPGVRPSEDVLGWWSGRGGELSKPELCAPGVAYSNVPSWQAGEEVSAGTSMAAPQVSGAAALLLSGLAQIDQRARATDLRRALVATATPVADATTIDQGAGVPNVGAAFRWLRAGHRAGRFSVRALDDGGNSSRATAAYRRAGLASAADTVQRFLVKAIDGQPFAKVLLYTDAPWLRAPEAIEFHGAPVTVDVRYDATQLRTPGLYVGTVWARPATDTLAGAAFGLTSTIIVPASLDEPLSDRRFLRAGRASRYFVAVPEDAGGLTVELTVGDREREATLYLFDPEGHPHLEVASVTAGGGQVPRAAIQVRADDLVPGVYEAVVVAPPAAGVLYALRASVPTVAVEEVTDRIVSLRNRRPDTTPVDVRADVIGAARAFAVGAAGDAPRRIDVRVPEWADELVIDVTLPGDLWPEFTDFAVTVWDTTGQLVSQGPLNYARSRERIPVDTLRGRPLEIEFFPALAIPAERFRWDADVQVAFIAAEPLARVLPASGSEHAVPGKETVLLSVPPIPWLGEIPHEFLPLVEAQVKHDGRVTSVRRAAAPVTNGTGQ